MNEQKHPELEQYPIVMKVKHVASVLGVCDRTASNVMNKEGFPMFHIGRGKRVYKDDFLNWLKEQSSQCTKQN